MFKKCAKTQYLAQKTPLPKPIFSIGGLEAGLVVGRDYDVTYLSYRLQAPFRSTNQSCGLGKMRPTLGVGHRWTYLGPVLGYVGTFCGGFVSQLGCYPLICSPFISVGSCVPSFFVCDYCVLTVSLLVSKIPCERSQGTESEC